MPRGRGTSPSDGEGREEVGYGRPPTHSRFTRGQSGNPAGRPKRKPGPANFADILAAELNREFVLGEGSRKQKTSKLQLMAVRLAHDAAKGDRKAIELVVKLVGLGAAPSGVEADDLSPDTIANYLKRHGAGEARNE